MNSEKIGKFLQRMRKECNLTQKQLADKVGVSDKTISKWESGLSLPDIQILPSLCDELGTNVNEVLSGERLSQNQYTAKTEENIYNLLNDNAEHKATEKTKLVLLLIGVSLLIVSFAAIFFLAYGRVSAVDIFEYIDIFALLTEICIVGGAVLISGRYRPDAILLTARRTIIPAGILDSVFHIYNAFMHSPDYASFAPTFARNATLPMIYALILYIILTVIEIRRNKK